MRRLPIRDGVAELSAAHAHLDLQVRVAVNTGEAIVTLAPLAQVGDGRGRRGQHRLPAPGLRSVNGVLVGEETYRATRSIVEYEAVEAVSVKGKSAPVTAWLALSATAPPGRAPRAAARSWAEP